MARYYIQKQDGVLTKQLICGSYVDASPIGTVLAYAGAAVPDGWFECNGQAVSRTAYKQLFKAIGTLYGEGDGSTTFNLPDYREVVLVGAGTNATDTIAAHDEYDLGQFKDDQMQTHQHVFNFPATGNAFNVYDAWPYGSGTWNGDGISLATNNPSIGNNTGRSGTTTHGKQKGVIYIIKASFMANAQDLGLKIKEREEVELYNAGSAIGYTGNITLSEPWTDFDELEVWACIGGGTEQTTHYWPTKMIEYVRTNSKTLRISGYDTYYRDYTVGADNLTFTTTAGNSYGINRIVGISRLLKG